MTETPELISLRKSLGGPLDGLPVDVQKQIAGNAIELVLDGVERGFVSLEDWEKRCIAEALQQFRGHHHELARAAARRALWPNENRRASQIRKHPIRPGMTTLVEFRRLLATARALPPALSFAKAQAARATRTA
jgi:hypothetical protein